jgi:hypothetical protein
MQNNKLAPLCEQLLAAKATEAKANEDRIAIEAKILAIVGIPDEGSETHEAPGFKIKAEQKIIRKLDAKAYSLIVDQIPEQLRPVKIVEEYRVDATGVKWLRDNEKGYYKLMCSCMTEKMAKPSVKIEVQA